MDKLTQLLDERWPLADDLTKYEIDIHNFYRSIFTEGYNARREEEPAELADYKIKLANAFNQLIDRVSQIEALQKDVQFLEIR